MERISTDCTYQQGQNASAACNAEVISMALFAFPGATVLVMRVSRFDLFQASGANENPITFSFDPDAVEHVIGFFTAATWLGANSLDLCHRC